MMNIYDLLRPRNFAPQEEGLLAERPPIPAYIDVERPLYLSEIAYFAQNPRVAGMMTDDQRVIRRPGYPDMGDAVKRNEYARLLMQDYEPTSRLSDEQKKFFKGTPYEGAVSDAMRSVLARLLTGDPSVKATFEQDKELRQLLQPTGLLGGF